MITTLRAFEFCHLGQEDFAPCFNLNPPIAQHNVSLCSSGKCDGGDIVAMHKVLPGQKIWDATMHDLFLHQTQKHSHLGQ